MGLYQSNFRFEGELPNLEAVRTEARRRLRWYGADQIEGLEVQGQTIIARSMLGPFTHPVLCAVLQEMGGQPVSLFDGRPEDAPVPTWAHAPISDIPWRDRMAIRYGWWAWLFGTARLR
jgi:hypothetical protein